MDFSNATLPYENYLHEKLCKCSYSFGESQCKNASIFSHKLQATSFFPCKRRERRFSSDAKALQAYEDEFAV